MGLWVACNNDTEVVTIFLFDEFNKLGSVSKSIFNRLPVLLSLWWITSECENILDTILLGGVKSLGNSIPSHACASKMHKYIDSHVSLNLCAKIESSGE